MRIVRTPDDGDRDGATYEHDQDYVRLNRQQMSVFRVMADHQWHTQRELEERTGANWASITARLRDLRKEKFGGFMVERRRVGFGRGTHEYRLVEED